MAATVRQDSKFGLVQQPQMLTAMHWSATMAILLWVSQSVSATAEECLPAVNSLPPITLNDSVTYLPEGDFIFPELQFLCNGSITDFNLTIAPPLEATFILTTHFDLKLYQYTGEEYVERASFAVIVRFNNLVDDSNANRVRFNVPLLFNIDFTIAGSMEVIAGDVLGLSPMASDSTCTVEVGMQLITCNPLTVLQGTPIAIARESSDSASHPIVMEGGSCWEPGVGRRSCTQLYMTGRPHIEVDFVPTSQPLPATISTLGMPGSPTEAENLLLDTRAATLSFIGLAAFFGALVCILLLVVLLMASCLCKHSRKHHVANGGDRGTRVVYHACSKEQSESDAVDMRSYSLENSTSRVQEWAKRMKPNMYSGLAAEEGDSSTFQRDISSKNAVKEHDSSGRVYDYPSLPVKGSHQPLAPMRSTKGHSGYANLPSINENYRKLHEVSIADVSSVGYDSFVTRQMEISRSSIIMGRMLGEGEYGTVYHGNWSRNGKLIHVAVKVCNDNCGNAEKATLLKEAETVGQFSHDRVVKLYGIISLTEPNMLVMEYVQGGSLESHLQRCREFSSQSKGNISRRFLRFCHEIADGMRYLAHKRFIHRDLAARNILLDKDYHCKIADFGLTRSLANSEYYSSKKGGRLPLRWTPPEAILYNKFSTMGDVWTYGIVMYEIWSLGELPYIDFTVEQIVQVYRTSGYCLPPPPGCPRSVYSTMVKCWNPQYHKRPTFQELYILLSDGNQDSLLSWREEDRSQSAQADVLGAPLEEGKFLYTDLQNTYIN